MGILNFIGRIGSGELLLILLALLILFGTKKIPELAKGLGKGIREFKKATKEVEKALEDDSPFPTPKEEVT